MAEHWKQVGCRFQSLYSGFLGSAGQIGLVEQIFDWFREENTLIMVDPVMGTGESSTKPTPLKWPAAWPACAAGRILWCPT